MCHFITAILPEDIEHTKLKPSVKRWNMLFEQVDNLYVQKQLRLNESYIRVTKKSCDCGTPLCYGSQSENPNDSSTRNIERKLQKFKKKGWSKTKIETWLSQQSQNKEKRQRVSEQSADWEPEGLLRWKDFISDFVVSNSLPYLGLLVHFYSQGVNTERIDILSNEELDLPLLTTDYLYKMKEDTIYRFKRPSVA